MNVGPHRTRPAPPASDDRLSSLGAFIGETPARVRAAAARHDGDARPNLVECELRGASMAGAIPRGSRIRIAFTGAPCGRGDVVAFMTDGHLVVHRIVYRRPRRRRNTPALLITRGDAMMLPDAPIDADAVVGRVVEMRMRDGWQQVGAPPRTPRRERLLACVALATIACLAHVRVPLARRVANWLQAMDHRFSWTRTFLYGAERRG